MDYSYFAPQAQPYQFFGIAPAKSGLSYTSQEEPHTDPLVTTKHFTSPFVYSTPRLTAALSQDIYDQNTYQYFDQNAHFNPTSIIPPPQSPPRPLNPTDPLPTPLPLPYDRSLSQELTGDVDLDQAPGRGSSDDDKDNLTPAQSRRKAQNRAAYYSPDQE